MEPASAAAQDDVMALRFASINVNGIRAAKRRGMAEWLAVAQPDVIALQEVRAPLEETLDALGDEYTVVQATGTTKGRAGVAVAARSTLNDSTASIAAGRFDDTGRWVEATVDSADGPIVVCSTYVHTGQADDPDRMEEKLAFLDAIVGRMQILRAEGRPAIVAGDFNVARDERDIKNWKGNRGKAGFLPDEQTRLDELESCGMVDVLRHHHGDRQGPYTWWSWRGRAYDNDAGWRIDHVFATPELRVVDATVDRAPSYDARWSDHAPVVVTFDGTG